MMDEKTLRRFDQLCEQLAGAVTERERQTLVVDFIMELSPDARPFFKVGEEGEELMIGGRTPTELAVWVPLLQKILVLARDAAAGLMPAPILEEQAFMVRLGGEVRRSRRYKTVLCLLRIDAPHLDLPGQRQTLESLRRIVRESDLVGRHDDRLFVVLPATERDGGEVTMRRVLEMLRVENPQAGWSARLAFFPYDGWTEEELLQKVDKEG